MNIAKNLSDFRVNATYEIRDFAGVTYLPFEEIELPAPIDWENILTARYGDWRKMIYTPPHVLNYSTDVPYNEYFQKAARITSATS